MPATSSVPLTVLTIVEDEHRNILLMRRHNTGFGDGMYSLPGGHVDKGENIHDAAVRECKEEVGIDVLVSPIIGVIHSNVDREFIHFVALVESSYWSGEVTNMEPDQCDHLYWCNPNSLPDNILPCIRIAIDNLYSGRVFSTYFPQQEALNVS